MSTAFESVAKYILLVTSKRNALSTIEFCKTRKKT
ncbi:unnamed protein product [Schistosoma curassoni]|uniref:Uncharacterized protein n=1 Tax=Schistosoma curassoni TaxID=6186 RepID=A0A183KUJ4_9TREM|nr:unnamed protein product [Schistosoma curassoni]